MQLLEQERGQLRPAIPVVLAHAILDGDDRVLVTPAGEEIDELLAGQALALADQVVLAVLVELGARHVQAQRSAEHTSELQSLMRLSYDVCCLTQKHVTT